MLLGVNIDHIATIREARKINEPDPLQAMFVASMYAEQITIHIREDRRHINDYDVKRIIESCPIPLNIESSISQEIIDFLIPLKPNKITLVPEKREEVTTEGGLDVLKYEKEIKEIINRCKKFHIEVSLFIAPSLDVIRKSSELKADSIEIHTGHFANIYQEIYSNIYRTHNSPLKKTKDILAKDLEKAIKSIRDSAILADNLGLFVAAGHGLNYKNITEIKKIKEIKELNIGHSIIARAVFIGLENAIKEMKTLIKRA